MTGTATFHTGRRANRLRPLIWGGAGALLLLPAVAMQFTAEVQWSGADFLAMGLLLATACAIYELGAWCSGNAGYRAGFGIAAATGLLTAWVNLAVGMLGREADAANLMFAGVLAVAAGGALLARLRPGGMAYAMAAAALAQLLAAGAGVMLGGYQPRALVLTALFSLPWFAAAALFRKAARET